MGWQEQLGKTSFFINGQSVDLVGGSFRGVPFHTVGAEVKVGRRNVVNEYPQRDAPYVDDLGRRARRFVVDCYVIGPDYLYDRDALIEAFETKGPGELIHPRYGSINVAVEGEASLKESPDQGGMARISVTFVEDGLNTFPKAVVDTVADVAAAADIADAAIQGVFGKEFTVSGPGLLAVQALTGLNTTVKGLLQTVRQVTSTSGLATIGRMIGTLTGNLADLIRTPVALVQSLRSIHAQLVTDLERPLAAFAEFQSVFAANTRSPAVALSGSTRARSLGNDTARVDLQRRLALTTQARVLAVAITNTDVVATADQAVALRDALVNQIDVELEFNDPPAEVATALALVRATVVRDVAARSEYLLQRSTFTPAAVLPALVLAHRIYQDATRADELVARNGVAHPAFVPARALEVLR